MEVGVVHWTRGKCRAIRTGAILGSALLLSAGGYVAFNYVTLDANTGAALRAVAMGDDPVLARKAVVKLYECAVANLEQIERAAARDDEAGKHARIFVEHLRRRIAALTAGPQSPPPQPHRPGR
jgi:hypothetical protein